jgi:hypothetical protein
MATMKLPDPLYYTLEDLAAEWQCHPDRLRTLAASGLLELSTADISGSRVTVVAVEERRRFEELASPAQAETTRLRNDERRGLLNLIGALAYIAYVDDVTRPYALTSTLQADAAARGIPLEIGEDAIADKLKDAFALMRERKCALFDQPE